MAKDNYVTINGIRYCRIRRTIGRDKHGEAIIKPFYGRTKREAERKYLKWRDDRVKGLTITGDISLTNAIHIWFWQIERYCGNKSSTFARYEVIYRLDVDGYPIGYMPLQDVDKLVLQRHYTQMHIEGKSYSKIKNCNKFLNKFFNYCLTEGFVIRNPCFRIDLKGYDDTEHELFIDDDLEDEGKIETLSEKELSKIWNGDINRKLKIIAKFAFGTGLRQGELIALEGKDIDLKKMEVRVTKTWSYNRVFDSEGEYEYKEQITTPKTRSSRRKVHLPSALEGDLREMKRIKAEERLKRGAAYQVNDLLFPAETGAYIHARNLKRSWDRALAKLGIPPRDFHALRHTFASKLLEKGIRITTVSRLLGHASIKTTEKYIHILESTKADAVQVLNELM